MNRGKGVAAEVFSFTGKLKTGSLVNNLRTVIRKAVKQFLLSGWSAISSELKWLRGVLQQAATFKLVAALFF